MIYINAAAVTAIPLSAANSIRIWLDPPVIVDGFTVAELKAEDAEVMAAVELAGGADGVAPELVSATKGPERPPCCCAGEVLFEVSAALALKMARVSEALDL